MPAVETLSSTATIINMDEENYKKKFHNVKKKIQRYWALDFSSLPLFLPVIEWLQNIIPTIYLKKLKSYIKI